MNAMELLTTRRTYRRFAQKGAFVENGCVVHDDMQVHREKKRYNKASKKRSK